MDVKPRAMTDTAQPRSYGVGPGAIGLYQGAGVVMCNPAGDRTSMGSPGVE